MRHPRAILPRIRNIYFTEMRLLRFNVFLRDGRSSASNGITKQISRTNLKTTKLDRVSEARLDSKKQTPQSLRASPCRKLRELTRFSALLAGLRGRTLTREHARTTYHVRKAKFAVVLRSCRHRCGKGRFLRVFFAKRELIKKKK